jgi:hypothetical protein
MYPWATLKLQVVGASRMLNGIFVPIGRAAVVAGCAGVASGVLMWLGMSLRLRRLASAAAAAVGFGVLAAVWSTTLDANVGMASWIDHTLEATAQLPASSEAIRQRFAQFGFVIDPAYGLALVALGGALLIAGAMLGLLARAPDAADLEQALVVVPEADLHHLRQAAVHRRHPSRSRRAVAVATSSILLFAAAGFVAFARPGTPASSTGPVFLGQRIWGTNSTTLTSRLPRIGLPALRAEALAYHIHEHLDLFINGERVLVPAGIGIDEAAGLITVLHTHTPDGVIHVEAPDVQRYTLGQFFDVWGVRLTARCLGGFCNEGTRQVRAFLDGAPFEGDPADIVLTEHGEIVIAYGTFAEVPTPLPSGYRFPPGL